LFAFHVEGPIGHIVQLDPVGAMESATKQSRRSNEQ
jgi:hypothetical protein